MQRLKHIIGKRLLFFFLALGVCVALLIWRYRDLIADLWQNLFLYYQD